MFCEKCGNAVTPQDRTCRICGNQLTPQATVHVQNLNSSSASPLGIFFTVLGIGIISIIAGGSIVLFVFIYPQHLSRCRISEAKTQIKLIEDALTSYILDMGRYPSQEEGLQALIENVSQDPKWDGPYLRLEKGLKDPWGNEYLYVHGGRYEEFNIISYGADGVPGGSGENADIRNHEI